jgi:DNA glycosylase AlkZ-like
LLAGPPARGPETVVERILAVQAQDPRGARLAIRARSKGLSAEHVDRALTQDRSLLITWLNRRTLHLVRSEDYPWLHALTAPTIRTGNERRLRQEGVSDRQTALGVRTIVRALGREGPLTRHQLRDRLDESGVPTDGQALVHLLVAASIRGLIVRGPMVGGHHAFVLVADWLGTLPEVDLDVAAAELARRYLAGHGPAGDRDLARWSGLPLRRVRAGLRAIAGELSERDDGLLDLVTRPRPRPLPGPKLLGAFDPLLLGWVSRAPILGEAAGIVTTNGVFRPFALIDGKAAATWTMPRGEVVLAPLRTLSTEERRTLGREARDVRRYLGLDRPSG